MKKSKVIEVLVPNTRRKLNLYRGELLALLKESSPSNEKIEVDRELISSLYLMAGNAESMLQRCEQEIEGLLEHINEEQ